MDGRALVSRFERSKTARDNELKELVRNMYLEALNKQTLMLYRQID